MRKQPLHPYTAIINKKQRTQARNARDKAKDWLVTKFPQAFATQLRIQPLKIGIINDLMLYAEEFTNAGISKSKIREAVVIFARSVEYLACLKAREMRIDLQGLPVGLVTEDEAEKAAQKLKRRVEKSVRNSRKSVVMPSNTVNQAKPKYTPRPVTASDFPHYQHDPITAYNGQTVTTKQVTRNAPVVIKRKTTRQYDPDSVARIKEKLGLVRDTEPA